MCHIYVPVMGKRRVGRNHLPHHLMPRLGSGIQCSFSHGELSQEAISNSKGVWEIPVSWVIVSSYNTVIIRKGRMVFFSVDNQHYLSGFGSIVSILDLIQLFVNLTNHRRRKDMNLPASLVSFTEFESQS